MATDVEDALRRDLSRVVPCCAPPVPESLGEALPFAMVRRDGGEQLNLVVDSHLVTVSVWGATKQAAMEAADRLAAAVRTLPYDAGTCVQWRSSRITATPFDAPDPDHPTIQRVQLTAAVSCRAI